MLLLLLIVFVIGAVSVIAVEAAGLWFLLRYLNRKVAREEVVAKAAASALFSGDVNSSLCDKQGDIWVLEPETVPKIGLEDKLPVDPRRKKDIFEVTPVRKHARIKDQCLRISELDGSNVKILLRGCKVAAVSATSLSSKKWAKRFPIKLESMNSVLYKGRNIVYIYLETSWEKESWCKALRLASCDDNKKYAWFSKLSMEFQGYLESLNAEYPSIVKLSEGNSVDLTNKSVKFDNSSSKVRQFLRKLARKTSKSGHEDKSSSASISNREDRKISEKSLSMNEKSRSRQESILSDGSRRVAPTGKSPNVSSDNSGLPSSISTSTDSGSMDYQFGMENLDSLHKKSDEGTMCLNLLISRLFFDAKNNQQIRDSIQQRIQRTLSYMRVPSYIGEVTCTELDLGCLPPRILAMRALPSEMNEVWSFEIDVEYLGGTVLHIETRLEVQELELEGEKMNFDTNTVGGVTSDVLEGFEDLGKQLKLSEETMAATNQNVEINHDPDQNENPKGTGNGSSQVSRWKCLLNSIAKQVSQVPLSLGIKISSIRGTMRLYMKPPPSDQIWYGFTSLPDITFNLESSVGDHKIKSGHLAMFLISRFKVAIRETLVLPNRESVCIPWMSAEKDDWIERNAAPFMWCKPKQESTNTTKREAPCFQPGAVTDKDEASFGMPPKSETIHEKAKTIDHVSQLSKSSSLQATVLSSEHDSLWNGTSSEELRAPLMKNDRLQGLGSKSSGDRPDLQSQSLDFLEGQTIHSPEVDDHDTRPRRIGTRERMFGLGKKMGEKLEVKRRHIEEKGRNFVERMRAP